MEKKIVWIVIPGYNEEKSIAKVVSELKRFGYRNVVFVDDGSADKSFFAAKKSGVSVLRHVVNRGQGAALQTGISYALKRGADVVVTFDADGQHRASDIKKLTKPVLDGKADIALGSRFLKRSKLPLLRVVLLKGAVFVQNFFYGISLSDAHNGFRAISRRAAESMHITIDRMGHASEIIDEIVRNKLRFVEVPVTIRYNKEVMRKGHGGFVQAFTVLFDMVTKKILK